MRHFPKEFSCHGAGPAPGRTWKAHTGHDRQAQTALGYMWHGLDFNFSSCNLCLEADWCWIKGQERVRAKEIWQDELRRGVFVYGRWSYVRNALRPSSGYSARSGRKCELGRNCITKRAAPYGATMLCCLHMFCVCLCVFVIVCLGLGVFCVEGL